MQAICFLQGWFLQRNAWRKEWGVQGPSWWALSHIDTCTLARERQVKVRRFGVVSPTDAKVDLKDTWAVHQKRGLSEVKQRNWERRDICHLSDLQRKMMLHPSWKSRNVPPAGCCCTGDAQEYHWRGNAWFLSAVKISTLPIWVLCQGCSTACRFIGFTCPNQPHSLWDRIHNGFSMIVIRSWSWGWWLGISWTHKSGHFMCPISRAFRWRHLELDILPGQHALEVLLYTQWSTECIPESFSTCRTSWFSGLCPCIRLDIAHSVCLCTMRIYHCIHI